MMELAPHILIAVLCIIGAIGAAGALIIWLAIELELKGTDKHNGEKS
jgi:hypothetical protein